MRQNLLVVLFVLSLFVAGSAAVSWQLWHSLWLSCFHAASQSVQRINALLDEAQHATRTVIPLTTGTCTPDAQQTLSREAAVHPHIRAVLILKGNTVWCSSLYVSNRLMLQTSLPSSSRLVLLSGDVLTPDTPVMLLFTPTPGGGVAVSISAVHLQNALVVLPDAAPLRIITDDRMLSSQGEILPPSPILSQENQIRSAHYPFSVSYPVPVFFSLSRLLLQGGVMMILVTLLSLTAGWLLRYGLTKSTSPEASLRHALLRGEIQPWGQPVVNGLTGHIHGFEVLARWQHPDSGFISPEVFIPLAEKCGLSDRLTHHLMQCVLEELRPGISTLPDGLHIAFNISAARQDFAQLREDCQAFLDAFGTKPVVLVLEITEREPVIMTDSFRDFLSFVRGNTIVLALDDFGTGYSGLASLTTLPVSYIKIDKIFVHQINETPGATRLLDAVIEMAERMLLETVAEGVETQAQADYLNSKRIHFLQGYLFGRPEPLPGLVRRINSERI